VEGRTSARVALRVTASRVAPFSPDAALEAAGRLRPGGAAPADARALGDALFGGVVVVETVFNFPGIGRLLTAAVNDRDLPLVQALGLVGAFFYIGTNLFADVMTLWLTPRLRTQYWQNAHEKYRVQVGPTNIVVGMDWNRVTDHASGHGCLRAMVGSVCTHCYRYR
jgi:hypothetical protein